VAEADPKDRFLAEEVADGLNLVREGSRIAGAVGEEDAIGIFFEDFLGCGGGGNDGDFAAELAEVAGDIPLHAVVDGDDVGAIVGGCGIFRGIEVVEGVESLVPFEGFFGDDFLNEVSSDESGTGLGLGDEGLIVEVGGGEYAFHSSPDAESADEGAGVDALNADDAGFLEVFVEAFGGAIVAGGAAEFLDNKAAEGELGTFDVFGVDAVVPDEGVGHRDDLATVRGIGEDLLVPGHASIEADLAIDFAFGTKIDTGIDSSVFESQLCSAGHGMESLLG